MRDYFKQVRCVRGGFCRYEVRNKDARAQAKREVRKMVRDRDE